MTNTSHSLLPALAPEQLVNVTGGGNAPLGGNVHQNINTNWGGSQTNIATQVINQAPKAPTTITEYMRTNPAARLEMIRRNSAVIGRH